MNKFRLAVWGINNAIWQVIKNSIDVEKAEVVLFIDSDEEKQGIYYENIPMIAPSKELLDRKDIDVYFIAALSAYENIRKLLIEWGIQTEKIQPFITDDICKYSLGMLDEVNVDFIKESYFEPEKRERMWNRYREEYAIYRESQYHGDAAWLSQETLISHGCGGIVNGRKVECSNSKEAFAYTVESKVRLMECDVMRMKNGELLLGHDLWRLYEAQEKGYTIMSLEDLLRGLYEYGTINCLLDVKWDTFEDFKYVINSIEKMLLYIAKDEKKRADLKSRIVMEVYDEETIKLTKQSNFHMFFTQYRNPERDYLRIANLCCQYEIGAVGVKVTDVDKKLINILREKGIKVFAYSTNCIEEYSRLRKMGIAGVFTDYLRPMVD